MRPRILFALLDILSTSVFQDSLLVVTRLRSFIQGVIAELKVSVKGHFLLGDTHQFTFFDIEVP